MASAEKKTVVQRAAGLSDEVLESVETGRRAAIEAVRKFVDTVNEATPALVDASRRKTIVDAALDLAERLKRRGWSFCAALCAAPARWSAANRAAARSRRPI